MGRTRAEVMYQVIRHVRPLFRALYKAVDDRLDGTGVTIPMRGVLEVLCDHGALTVPQIAYHLQVKRQVVQGWVDELRELGWVERLANELHKRSWRIQITDRGRAKFNDVRAREHEVTEQVAQSVSLKDLDATLRVLSHMTESFRRIAGQTGSEGEET